MRTRIGGIIPEMAASVRLVNDHNLSRCVHGDIHVFIVFCCLIDAIDFFVLICNSTEGFVRAEIAGSVFGCLHIYIYIFNIINIYIYMHTYI